MGNETVSFQESLFVGITYFLFATALLLIYIVYNLVLLRDNEFRKLQAFRLMIFLGLLDCTQLLAHISSGILTIHKDINHNYPYLSQVLGAVINSGWVGLFPLTFIIAINRFLTFRKIIDAEGRIPWLMKIAVALSFLYCFGFCICLLTFANVMYYPESFSWSYGSNKASVVMSGIEYIVSVICIGLTFLVYILIAVSIYRMTRGVVSVKRREIVLVVHAALLFFTLTTLITCWHYYSIFLPESVWTYFSINIYWMLYCGLNPILHMAFSKCANAHFLVTFHWIYGCPAKR
ncbi:hypothetical protein RB195_015402 [Necator americanus]|uniref:G-protein coupled receptors family 1 profile domain-containing protein n=1 Tax=Necator americanus TaxID=51031 RepID=A0ABR1E4F6_NECAM